MIEKYEILAFLNQGIWLLTQLTLVIFCFIYLSKKKTRGVFLMAVGSLLWFLSQIGNILLTFILPRMMPVEDFLYYQQFGYILSSLCFVIFVIGCCMLLAFSVKSKQLS